MKHLSVPLTLDIPYRSFFTYAVKLLQHNVYFVCVIILSFIMMVEHYYLVTFMLLLVTLQKSVQQGKCCYVSAVGVF